MQKIIIMLIMLTALIFISIACLSMINTMLYINVRYFSQKNHTPLLNQDCASKYLKIIEQQSLYH
jgi:hypothetical protein